MKFTLKERTDGYFELYENGKIKSCPYQSLFFYPNPVDPRQILTHKQPCCSDCSLMHVNIEQKSFTRHCEQMPREQSTEVSNTF